VVPIIIWALARRGVVVLNTDEAIMRTWNLASCGGILQDDDVSFIFGFAAKITSIMF